MTYDANRPLLGAEDALPVAVVNPDGSSPFLLIGDHAGGAVPKRLGDMGVAPADWARHIAIDIGIRALGETLADRLDAAFLHQRYSRLVIDCNRNPAAADAIPAVSDGTPVPANADLQPEARAARIAAIHAPYQDAIASAVVERVAAGRETILIALHSFTPVMHGRERPWHVGILHDGHDDGYAHALLAALTARGDLIVGDNEPYRMDLIDHTVPRHAFPARLSYAEIEVRQDLIAYAADISRWCAILADALETAAQGRPASDPSR